MQDYLASLDWVALRSIALIWGVRLGGALLVFWIGKWIARRIARRLSLALGRAGSDAILTGFAQNVVFGVGMAVVIVAALGVVGVPNASLLAVLGAAGLGIGLALKDSLANLASGVLLVLFRPFRAGDYVEIAGQGGSVTSIELMFTRLATPDNREILVPNGEVTTNPIINFNARESRRIDLVVGVAYENEAQEALDVIREALSRNARVLAEPAPQLMVLNLNESSVDLAVRPWVKTADYWAVRSELLRDIKRALEHAGIEIPFPQRTVRVIGAPPAAIEATAAAAD